MADNLNIFDTTYPNATGIKAKDTNGNTQTFVKPSGTKTITGSGTTDVSAYANASVAAGSLVSTATYSITPSVSVDSDGLVTVAGETSTTNSPVYTSGWIANTETQYVTLSAANTYQLSTQAAKTVNPSTTSQTAVAAGKYTTGAVTVAAMPTMTLPTSTSASATSGYTSKATVSRSTSDQYINIPTGYNSSGAYYKVNAVANGSATAPASISGSSATVSTGTNTLTLTKTVSVTPSVTAGYVSSGTAGNSSVSLTASVTTKGATTYHPSTSDQTIASGFYTTGAQTIKAVLLTNLIADNIKKDVVVKIGDSADDDCVTSVTGTYEGGGSSIDLDVMEFTPTEDTNTIIIDNPSKARDWIFAILRDDVSNLTNGHIALGFSTNSMGGGMRYRNNSGNVTSNANMMFTSSSSQVSMFVQTGTNWKFEAGLTYTVYAGNY